MRKAVATYAATWFAVEIARLLVANTWLYWAHELLWIGALVAGLVAASLAVGEWVQDAGRAD